ncbi:carbon-nitrogen hydrolase family protein [Aminobacter aminovorans]|uniref:carbon-nitrogen hydrolase family protein n=1 Tax=Aminobacter aminovorans TaxID=83263 RepID=UPI002854400D|nr:carbon-nitrogen hydrolase family protein [Aminobacter aminovorans]MDR7222336.1 nitrilase [Aminobacter aminovorans]
MKISLIQTNPQKDRAQNLRDIGDLMLDAVRTDRPDLIVLPEYFEYYGGSIEEKLAAAEAAPSGTAYRMASAFAREHGVYVHAGTIMEKVEGEDRIYNTSFVFDREGRQVAAYRKIHMFDIVAPDGTAYKESASVKPGEDIVTYDIDGVKVGCAICYDIRFFELFLQLEKAGCDIIVLPAAFTLQTGKDHWEVLARARAIETQTYFVACGQTGATVFGNDKRHCWGHSLVCDPWGHVVAKASDGVGFVTARVDPAQIKRARTLIPMTQHRRLACA